VTPGETTFFLSNAADPTSGAKFVYTTDRCEQVHLIAQVSQHPPWTPVFYVQYMFDEVVPTPELLYLASTPSWFSTHSMPFTMCPPTEGGTVSLYISIGMLSLAPGLQAEVQFTLETVGTRWLWFCWLVPSLA
jgi:hypothetical protein